MFITGLYSWQCGQVVEPITVKTSSFLTTSAHSANEGPSFSVSFSFSTGSPGRINEIPTKASIHTATIIRVFNEDFLDVVFLDSLFSSTSSNSSSKSSISSLISFFLATTLVFLVVVFADFVFFLFA